MSTGKPAPADTLRTIFEKKGRTKTEQYSLTKPFANVGKGSRVIEETVQYFYNFINMIELIQPSPRSLGSRCRLRRGLAFSLSDENGV